MKKFLALLAALSLVAFAGSAFATEITAPSEVFVIVGTSATATVTGKAAHEDGKLAFTKTGGPDWANIEGNTVTFAPGSDVDDGPHPVTITVTETYPVNPSAGIHSTTTYATETNSTTINALVYNIKPITLTPSNYDVPVTAGTTTGSVTLSAPAANGGDVDYSIVAGPTWATRDGSTLTFEPGADVDANTYPVAVRATETYTLDDGVTRIAVSPTVTINVIVAAAPVVVEPVTSPDQVKDTGDDDVKTSENDVPSGEKTDTSKTITETSTEEFNVTVQVFVDPVTAAAKIVVKVTQEVTTQTVEKSTEKVNITTTENGVTSATEVINTIEKTTITTQTTTVTAEQAATDFLAALKGDTSSGNTQTTNTEEDTTAQASQQAIAVSLFKGKTDESGLTAAADTSFISNMAQTKDDGTQESYVETFMRVVEETIQTAARVLNATNPATAQKLRELFSLFFPSFSPAYVMQDVFYSAADDTLQVVNSSALQNASFTKDDGTETTESLELDEVMPMLAKQAQQKVLNAAEGTEERTNAEAELAEIQQEVPVVITTPVALSDDAETSIAMLNLPLQKKDMYGKKISFRALKQKKSTKFSTAAFMPAALDTNEDGNGIFLNSIGQEVTTVPGEGQWGIPVGETEERLVIPGQITAAILMKPGMVYIPVVTTPVEELSTIEGVSAASEQKTVSVDVTTTRVVSIEVLPVYDNDAFSTSFDEDLEAYFESEGYDIGVGEFIVPGDEGGIDVTTSEDTAMLVASRRAVVRTIQQIAPMGDTAASVARYVMRVRYDIPKDTDTTTISSADTVLAFWPHALVTAEGTVASKGEALFLTASGDSELTASMVRRIAKGELGESRNDTTQSYTGYIVMTLAKLSADDEWYKPVITVKREAVVAAVTSPDQPGETTSPDQPGVFTITPSQTALTLRAGATATVTMTSTVSGVSYSTNRSWASVSGNTITITAPSASDTVTITGTAPDGRTAQATITVTITSDVTPTPTPGTSEDVSPDVRSLGSSGGGCDAGFGALALALLGGFIAARKK